MATDVLEQFLTGGKPSDAPPAAPSATQQTVPSADQEQREAERLRILRQELAKEQAKVGKGDAAAQARTTANIQSLQAEIGRQTGQKPVAVSQPQDELMSFLSGGRQPEPEPPAPAPAPRVGTRAQMPAPFVAQGQDLTMQQVPGKVADAARRLLQGGASLADIVIGAVPSVVGEVGYAVSRAAGAGPERAGQIREQIAGPYQNVIGRALDITQTPGYKGEATRATMDFVAQNIGKGADWISQQTGLPKSDVENMINTLTVATAPPIARATKYVGEALAPITEITEPSKKPKISYTSYKQALEAQRAGVAAAEAQRAPPPGSVGAAGVTKQTQVESLLAQSTNPELQQRIKSIPINEVNPEALQIRLLEDKYGINLTQGQRTGNKKIYANEWNNRAAHPDTLGPLFESQPRQIMEAIDNLKYDLTPDVRTSSPSQLGQTVINRFVANDKARLADIDAKYQALRDAAGGDLPVDAPKLFSNIETRLKKDLQLTDAEGMSQFKELKRLADSNAMTYDNFLALRRNLGTEARTNTNGTIRNIAGTMIEELEKLPLRQEAANLQPLAQAARSAAKARFDLIKANPAYKDALSKELSPTELESGLTSIGAEKFIDRHIQSKGGLMRVLDELGRESDAHQAIRAHELENLKVASGFKEGKGDFTPRGMTNYLHQRRDRLFDIYGPQGVQNLMELDLIGSRIAQPKANVFNTSNTTASLIGEFAKKGLTTGAEGWLSLHTSGLSQVPIGIGKQLFQNAKNKAYGQKAVDPYSGLSIKD